MTHRQAMKLENQRVILLQIASQPVSRIALAGRTGLTQASVSLIVDELIRDGIVEETEKSTEDAGVGRKPTLLGIRKEWGCFAGISIDRDGCDVGLVNLGGEVLDAVLRFPCDPDFRLCLDRAADSVRVLLARNPSLRGRVLSAGAAVPGPLDEAAGKMLNPPGFFPEWYGLELHRELSARLPLPLLTQHNSVALAKAEKCYAPDWAKSSFVLLNVNAGLGAGLFLNGSVYTARNGYGGELGHTSIDLNGPLCTCGNRGCLEQFASVSAVLHQLNRLRPEIGSWKELTDAACGGDPICGQFIEDEARYLAQAVVNLNNLLGIEAAVIAGQIAYRPERLLDAIRRRIGESSLTKAYRSLEVRTTAIRGNPYIISGAAIPHYRLFHEPMAYDACRRARNPGQ